MTHTAIRSSISAFAALALVCAFAGPAPAQTGTPPTLKKKGVQTPKGPPRKKALQAQSKKKQPYQAAADDAASTLGQSMGF